MRIEDAAERQLSTLEQLETDLVDLRTEIEAIGVFLQTTVRGYHMQTSIALIIL